MHAGPTKILGTNIFRDARQTRTGASPDKIAADPKNQAPCFNFAGESRSLLITGLDVPRITLRLATRAADGPGSTDATLRTRLVRRPLGILAPQNAWTESYPKWPGVALSGRRPMCRRVSWQTWRSPRIGTRANQLLFPAWNRATALTNIPRLPEYMVSRPVFRRYRLGKNSDMSWAWGVCWCKHGASKLLLRENGLLPQI